jgi:hypothetical protein
VHERVDVRDSRPSPTLPTVKAFVPGGTRTSFLFFSFYSFLLDYILLLYKRCRSIFSSETYARQTLQRATPSIIDFLLSEDSNEDSVSVI